MVQRNLILGSLLTLAAAAWGVLLWQRFAYGQNDTMGLTMGMAAPLFLAIWVTMMVAMMFPTAAPMILTFARIHAGKRKSGQYFVPTWVFVGGYLVVWTAFGAAAFGAALGAQGLADRSAWLMDNAGRVGGGILVLAGLYQLSPLKRAA